MNNENTNKEWLDFNKLVIVIGSMEIPIVPILYNKEPVAISLKLLDSLKQINYN